MHGSLTQVPLLQNCAPGQTLPQTPQLFLSVLVLISQPSVSFMLQSPNPALQAPMLHALATHCEAALA